MLFILLMRKDILTIPSIQLKSSNEEITQDIFTENPSLRRRVFGFRPPKYKVKQELQAKERNTNNKAFYQKDAKKTLFRVIYFLYFQKHATIIFINETKCQYISKNE